MDMIARISKTLPLILLLSCSLPSNAFAFPILEHDHSQPTLISFGYSTAAYDADTDIFTARLRDPYGKVPDLGYVDLSGVLDLFLMVDETGALSGGAVSWVGGSPDFGIADGTLLFSGTVANFAYGLDPAPQFHALIDIDTVLPHWVLARRRD